MQSASVFRRVAFTLALSLAVAAGGAGCSRWAPIKTYEVPTQADAQSSYAAVLEVVKAKEYTIVAEDPQNKRLRLEARVSGSDASSKSFIDVEVVASSVRLSAAGSLVQQGKVHKSLSREIASLEGKLKDRLASGAPVAAPAGTSAATPVAEGGAVPQAWSEPAYDPSIWGNGNFTCLPVKVPQEHQAALSIRLSNGEKADLQLSLAYAPELCRSPAQCKLAGGCPALGIGDTERVSRLAQRLSKGEIAAQATLLDSGAAVATIDLSRHGSIVQAMSEIKK